VNEARVVVVGEWQEISLDYKMSDSYWQLGCSTNYGFTIYFNNTEESIPLIYKHAAAVNKVNAEL
jgi:hypothetical protein